MKKILIILLLSLLSNGCINNAVKVTGNPQKTITLEKAFKSIGKSLRALDEATGDQMFGIAASEIEVTFNISSTATDSRGVNISTPLLPNVYPGGGSSSYQNTNEYTGNNETGGSRENSNTSLGENSLSASSTIRGARANQVTVKFESILKLIHDLNVEQIKLLREMGYFDRARVPQLHEMMFDGDKMTIDPTKKTN